MKRRINQWISIQIAKYPGRVVILAILLFNIVFFLLSALIISQFSLSGTENMGFLQAAFCTITMILDAGCIQFVIEDIGQSGVITALICLIIVIIGMISFTGAVIGYVTNYISSFIENANDGYRKLQGYPRVTHPSATQSHYLPSEEFKQCASFDLHVLSTPPAFILSQDQTLILKFDSQNLAWLISLLLF